MDGKVNGSIFSSLAQNAQKAATVAGNKAKKAVTASKEIVTKAVDHDHDHDHDGEITRKGFTSFAESVETVTAKTAGKIAEGAKTIGTQLSRKIGESRRLSDMKTLRPLFASDIQQEGFTLSKMIRLTEMDKRRLDSDVCRGSIGYMSVQGDLNVVNIFRKDLALFPLSLYPNDHSELYYVDPIDPGYYIAFDEYFEYLQRARVGELQRIAQDLGATHFRITFKEQKRESSSHVVEANGGKKRMLHLHASSRYASKDYSTIEVAAEMDFEGHDPTLPSLSYYKEDSTIQTLIDMRMHKNPMKHQVYTLSLNKSSGISREEAVKIDAAIHSMSLSGSTSVLSEVQNEGQKVIEYEIDF